MISTKHRSVDPEIMDNFAMEGDILQDALDKIAKINQLLGGNKLTLNGVRKLLNSIEPTQKITLADIGCGNGDMLRKLADFGHQNGYEFELIGFDANDFTIGYAKKLSLLYPNIRYEKLDIFDKKFQNFQFDIALCTLTLHHFDEPQIEILLQKCYHQSRKGIVINDLHRNIVAYRLFQLLCLVFNLQDMSKQDGLTSILRGFKKHELINLSKKLSFKKFELSWRWAFRYQWIIYKT